MRVQRSGHLAALVIAAILPLAVEEAAGADLFDALYARGQKQNAQLHTFTASFTETTSSSLLTRPLVARGKVAVERPSRIALTYTDPDQRLVIIDGDRMTVSWPSRRVLQTKDIGASQRRVQKYFVNGTPDDLRGHFAVSARQTADGPYVITMVPTRKQIKEGLSRLELTIDPATLLLSGMTMTFPNGDTKQMTFTDVTPNAPIDQSMFKVPQEGKQEPGK
ncbi:MAG: LolA family protein [Vicinamibacterales bacterium]